MMEAESVWWSLSSAAARNLLRLSILIILYHVKHTFPSEILPNRISQLLGPWGGKQVI